MDTSNPINVVIVDKHVMFRAGIKTSLMNATLNNKCIRVVAESESGSAVLNLIRHLEPGVVLIDLNMPNMDGASTMAVIKKLYPTIKVIMMVDNESAPIAKLMEDGANSCILKTSMAIEFITAIHTVYEKQHYFNEVVNKALLDNTKTKNGHNHEAEAIRDVKLNEKEILFLKHLCGEKSIKETAELIGLSDRTVESMKYTIRDKVGVKTVVGLAIYAIRSGIFKMTINSEI